MKNAIIFLTVFFLVVSIAAQNKKEVKFSEKAKAAFAKVYPNATDVKWQKEGKSYEVEFKQNGLATSIDIDSEGNISETESTIAKSDLPKGVEDYVAMNCKGWIISEAAKIVNAKGEVKFEAQVSKGKQKKDLFFTKDGTFIVKK